MPKIVLILEDVPQQIGYAVDYRIEHSGGQEGLSKMSKNIIDDNLEEISQAERLMAHAMMAVNHAVSSVQGLRVPLSKIKKEN